VLASALAAPGLMGCNQHGSTLESVTVAPANQSMAKGTTQQFTAIGTFSNGMALTWSQVVTWSSSNTAVATISNTAGSNGLVTSVEYGTTDITAFDAANNISGAVRLIVAAPDSITVIPVNPYMAVGTAHQFSALSVFSGGTVTQVITTFAKWTALSPSVATIADTPGVAGNGVVTAGAVPGTADIQATDPISGATGTTTITVTSTSIASIAVSPISPIISLSTTTLQQFAAIGTFQDGLVTPSLTTTWSWSSSNTAVATIDDAGLARAVAPGITTIKAIDPITGVSASTILTLQ
jgi:hypothetical protein